MLSTSFPNDGFLNNPRNVKNFLEHILRSSLNHASAIMHTIRNSSHQYLAHSVHTCSALPGPYAWSKNIVETCPGRCGKAAAFLKSYTLGSESSATIQTIHIVVLVDARRKRSRGSKLTPVSSSKMPRPVVEFFVQMLCSTGYFRGLVAPRLGSSVFGSVGLFVHTWTCMPTRI